MIDILHILETVEEIEGVLFGQIQLSTNGVAYLLDSPRVIQLGIGIRRQ